MSTDSESPSAPPSPRILPLIFLAALGVASVVGMAVGLPMGTGRENPLFLFLGRFHPLVVHFPIAWITLAAVFELLGRMRPFAHLRAAVPSLLVLAAVTSGLAVWHGCLLGSGGGDTSETLEDHLWSGVALAVVAFCLPLARALATATANKICRRVYQAMLAGAVGLMVVASHLGGNLTHGSDYLVKYLPPEIKNVLARFPGPVQKFLGVPASQPATAAVQDPTLYEALIAPAFEAHCVSCHNADKTKGGLRMDSLAGLMKGGDLGPAITPGSLKDSEVHVRVTLPMDDDEFMPPDGKEPLDAAELEALTWWIESGLPGETLVGAIPNPPPGIKKQIDAFLAARPTP